MMRLLTIFAWIITFSLLPLTEFDSAMGQQSGGTSNHVIQNSTGRVTTQNPAVTTPTQPFSFECCRPAAVADPVE